MKDNNIYLSNNDCKLLISAYDGDKDNKLDYKEFEKLALTSDHGLKMRSYGRPEPYIGFRDKLNYDIEYELSKLFKMEIERLKDLHYERNLIKSRYDFSRLDFFKAIDTYKVNSILRDDLRSFLNKNGQYANVLDVEHLMKRMDLDGDGRVSY